MAENAPRFVWQQPLIKLTGRHNAGEDAISTLPVALQLYDSLATNINQLRDTLPHPRLPSFPDPPVNTKNQSGRTNGRPSVSCRHTRGPHPIPFRSIPRLQTRPERIFYNRKESSLFSMPTRFVRASGICLIMTKQKRQGKKEHQAAERYHARTIKGK